MFDSIEPVGSGCVAQVYRGWAKADQIEDPTFQALLKEMDKKDLLEAWEIPGLGGTPHSFWQFWKRKKKEDVLEGRKYQKMASEEHSAEKRHLIPVAIKVGLETLTASQSCVN